MLKARKKGSKKKMFLINYKRFTKEWLKRAEREDEPVDKGDKFISLWIAFNGWLKYKFGEQVGDRHLINKVKNLEIIKNAFNELKLNEQEFIQDLLKLSGYFVIDMRETANENREKKYTGTFESLIEVIYLVRCNLFHGRKNLDEDEKDFNLICLSYDILLPLFKKTLENDGTS